MPVLKHQATWEYCYFLQDAMVHNKTITEYKLWEDIHCWKACIWFKYLCLPTLNWSIMNINFYVNWRRKLLKIRPGWNNSKLNYFAAYFFSLHKVKGVFRCLDFLLRGLDIQGIVRDAEPDAGMWHVKDTWFLWDHYSLITSHMKLQN